MNLVCFSPKQHGIDVLKEIIRGGADKIREAGASLMGGHSVDDPEIKYGLSVTGIVHPEKILRNEGAQPEDLLIVTKPLGTGIVNTGIKGDATTPASIKQVTEVMAALNAKAAEAMRDLRVHAATDVTGFGLAGHLTEMIKDYIGVELYTGKLPHFGEAKALAKAGFLPGGLYRNRDFYSKCVIGEPQGFFYDLIFDPQTSGGLLLAMHPDDLPAFEKKAGDLGVSFWSIGRFVAEPQGKILLT
jgi:selenide,water dikinase